MPSNFCIFFKDKKPQLGVLSQKTDKKIQIMTETGSSIWCSLNQVELSWNAEALPTKTTTTDVQNTLTQQKQKLLDDAAKIDLQTMHELCEPDNTYELQELAQSFLKEPEDGWQQAALWLAIEQDKFYFARKKRDYLARSKENLEILAKQQAQAAAKQQQLGLEAQWAKDLLNGQAPNSATNPELSHFTERLHNFTLHTDQDPNPQYWHNLFKLPPHEYARDRQLLGFLKLLQQPLSWGKLLLLRNQVQLNTPQELVQATEDLCKLNQTETDYALPTVDETHLEAYTIDQSKTKDYDDAISFEEVNPNISIIRVHIADVASKIKPESLLFQKASQQISSVYTLKENYPMLTEELAEKYFSLVAGESRATMTFAWKINCYSQVLDCSIYRSIIRVHKNLTYSKINQYLEQAREPWQRLYEFIKLQKEKRLEQGAVNFKREGVELDISDPQNIQISQLTPQGPAEAVVEELAIATNAAAAEFCHQHRLSVLYRSQATIPNSVQPNNQNNIALKPVQIGLHPDPHASLGLNLYTQISSPIRRFTDLVGQHIIFSGLSKQTQPYTEQQLLVWGKHSENKQKEYRQLEQELLNHWKIKYLHQHQNEAFWAECEPTKQQHWLLFFPDLQLKHKIRQPGLNNGLQQVVIQKVDIEKHQLYFSVVNDPL